MKLLHPTLLTALSRDYALGTMNGGARRRFERLLLESPTARAELARWQEQLATLAAVVPPMEPQARVWAGLTQRLGLRPARQALPWWYRMVSGLTVGALAGVLVATVLLKANPAWLDHEPLREELPASYVGLLSNAAGKPAVLLSSRRQGSVLTAKMLQALPPPDGQVGLLWAFPKDGSPPFLVGPLPISGAGKLSLAQPAEKLFFTVERLGVSFEPKDSTPAAPSGPLVVSGPCVKLW